MAVQQLRIFVSSPGDVIAERRRMILVVEKLKRQYARFFSIEPYLWESEPMLASGHFQDCIELPSHYDILVLILWSRLGTALPERTAVREYRGIDGRSRITGTEWEFEEALAEAQRTGSPDLLVYRKTAEVSVPLSDTAKRKLAARQWEALTAFWQRHFEDRGQFQAGFSTFNNTDEFERAVEEHLRKLIERRINERTRQSGRHELDELTWFSSPFQGLNAYSFENAPIFFGRDEAIRRAVEQLLGNADSGRSFLLVRGASGSGKSSLVQAGVVPALVSHGVVPRIGLWRRALCRPGGHEGGPFFGLAQALISGPAALPELLTGDITLDALVQHLRGASNEPNLPFKTALALAADAARAKETILAHEQPRLVLVIDQLEELYTDTSITAEERIDFVKCLAGLARSGVVLVLATMRSDHWHLAAQTPLLIDMAHGYGTLDLLAPDAAEIAEILRAPTATAGIAFERHGTSGIALDAALLAEAAGEPGALPLLSFLLDAMYRADIENGGGHLLTWATYDQVGRMKGAIAGKAEEVLSKLPLEVQAALPLVLRALVTVSRVGAEATARSVAVDEFPEGSPSRQLVETFLASDVRLLVANVDAGRATVRPAHEALINAWERARLQIAQDRRDLETRARIEEAEALWRAVRASTHKNFLQGKRAGKKRLLSGLPLEEGCDLLARWRDGLPSGLTNFIRASAAHERARRRLKWVMVGTTMTVLVILTAISMMVSVEWLDERRKAQKSESMARAEQSLSMADQGFFINALNNLAYVLPRTADGLDRPLTVEAFSAMLMLIQRQPMRQILAASPDDHPLTSVVVNPDASMIAASTPSGRVLFWSTTDLRFLGSLSLGKGPLTAAATTRDGREFAFLSENNLFFVPAASRSERLVRKFTLDRSRFKDFLLQHSDALLTAAPANPQHWRDRIAWWPDGRRVYVPIPVECSFSSFHDDGELLSMNCQDGTFLYRHNPATRKFDRVVAHIASDPLSSRGNVLCTSSDTLLIPSGSDVQVASVKDAKVTATLSGHSSAVYDIECSSDGRMAVTTAGDYSAKVWDLTTGTKSATLRGDLGGIWGQSHFIGNRGEVLSLSRSGGAYVWDPLVLPDHSVIALLKGTLIYDILYSPEGHIVVHSGKGVSAFDRNRRLLWSRPKTRYVGYMRHYNYNWAENGATIYLASKDEKIQKTLTWSPRRFDGTNERFISDSLWDGRVLLATNQRRLLVWDPTSNTAFDQNIQEKANWLTAEFLKDQDAVLVGLEDSTILEINYKSGSSGRRLRLGEEGDLQKLYFDSTGNRVVALGYKRADLIDIGTLAVVKSFRAEGKAAFGDAAFSPKGDYLALSSDDGKTRIIDTVTWKEIGVDGRVSTNIVPSKEGSPFTPDSRYFVGSYGKWLFVSEVRTGKTVAKLFGHELNMFHAVFTKDGKTIVSYSAEGAIGIWDWIPPHREYRVDMEARLPVLRLPHAVDRIRIAKNAMENAQARYPLQHDELRALGQSEDPRMVEGGGRTNVDIQRSILKRFRNALTKKDFQGALFDLVEMAAMDQAGALPENAYRDMLSKDQLDAIVTLSLNEPGGTSWNHRALRHEVVLRLMKAHPDWSDANPEQIRSIALNELALANALLMDGDAANAKKHAEDGLRKLKGLNSENGSDASYMNTLGYSWVEREENLLLAVSMLEHVVKMSPDSPHYQDSLGWAYVKIGRGEKAVPLLENALGGLKGTSIEALVRFHLGEAYWTVGRREDARTQWGESLALGPVEKIRKQMEKRLGETAGEATSNSRLR